MAMEQLLKIAERTEAMPDEMLAQVAAQGEGMGSLLAATEMKAREDIRQDAQQQNMQQQPPVLDQLLQRAMPQQIPQQIPQQMPQQMPQQQLATMGMQPDMYQGDPAMAMLNQNASMPQEFANAQMGIAQANIGGLVRRFSTGRLLGLQDDQLSQDYIDAMIDAGYVNPYDIQGGTMFPQGTTLSVPDILASQAAFQEAPDADYSDVINIAGQNYTPPTTVSGPHPIPAKQAKDQYIQAQIDDAIKQRQLQAIASSGLPQGRLGVLPTSAQYQSGQPGTTQAFISRGANLTALPSTYGAPSITQLQNVAAGGPALNMPGAGVNVNTASPSSSGTQTQAGAVQQNVGSGGAQTQAGQQSGVFTPSAYASGKVYKDTQDIAGDDDMLGQSVATILGGDAASRGLTGPAQSGSSGDSMGYLTRQLNDKYMKTLMDREAEAEKRLNKRLESMETLEKDFPTRENIKKRLKEQTDFGVAAAFFKAAASDKPDFLAAISEGFAGATDVMSKMTAQEQKELYKHAMDTYTRESNKANTDYKRQQDLLKKIDTANTTRLTLARNQQTSNQAYQQALNNDFWKRVQYGLDVKGIADEQRMNFLEHQQTVKEAWIDSANEIRKSNIEAALKVTPREENLYAAVLNNAAEVGLPGAIQVVNRTLDDIMLDLDKVYKSEVEAGKGATALQQAMAQIKQNYEDENKIGSQLLLDNIGYDLSLSGQFGNDPKRLLEEYKKLRPYLRYNQSLTKKVIK